MALKQTIEIVGCIITIEGIHVFLLFYSVEEFIEKMRWCFQKSSPDCILVEKGCVTD